MEKSYWIGRKRAAIAMARRAATSETRLIHYELAGRYSIKAAHCLPFLMVKKNPSTEGGRAALRLPHTYDPPRGSIYREPPPPEGRDGEDR